MFRERVALSPFYKSGVASDADAASATIFLDSIRRGNPILHFVVSGCVLRATTLAEPAALIPNQASFEPYCGIEAFGEWNTTATTIVEGIGFPS